MDIISFLGISISNYRNKSKYPTILPKNTDNLKLSVILHNTKYKLGNTVVRITTELLLWGSVEAIFNKL